MRTTERTIHKVSVTEEAVFDYKELTGTVPPVRDIKKEVETYLASPRHQKRSRDLSSIHSRSHTWILFPGEILRRGD